MPTAPAWHAPPSAFDRVRGAGRRDRRSQVGRARTGVDDARRCVELEDGSGCATLEVPGEGAVLPADVLLPADVRRVPRERDVGSCRVVQGVRDRLARVEQLEVVASDEARHEDRVVDADLLGPGDPRHRRSSGSQRPGGDARVLGVDGGVLVERACAFLDRASRGTRRSGSSAPLVSSTLVCPAVPLPTATQWKPPSAPASATALAANTSSLVTPLRPGLCSYQTTHGTVSDGPVNASSGSIPSRVGSMLRVGSPVVEDAPVVGSMRSSPTCSQQKPLTVRAPFAGLPPHGVALVACLTPARDEDLARPGSRAVELLPCDPGNRGRRRPRPRHRRRPDSRRHGSC